MAKAVVLLWLDGPMQSWGTKSRWDIRDSAIEPTKSGVIGLIGCALGLRRGDQELERLDKEIRFGVRIDRPGVISTDFHTVTGYHRTAAGEFKHSDGTTKSLDEAREHGEYTIVSPRDYLHDAKFLVALETSDWRADQIRKALSSPKWPLFLGRKSCPPCRPLLCTEPQQFEKLEEALSSCPRQPCAKEGKLSAYIEDPSGSLERQDSISINQLRMYGFRNCRYEEVDPPCSCPD